MELQGIRYFLAAARLRNFTKAAEYCFVSEPALSRKIKLMEQEWGVRLFERTTHGIVLTREGEELYHAAERVVAEYENFQNRIADVNGRNTLRVGCSTKGEHTYVEQFSRLMFYQCAVRLEAVRKKPLECIEKLMDGSLDVIISNEPMVKKIDDIEYQILVSSGIGAFIPSDWEIAKKKEISVKELEPYPVVTFPRSSGPDCYDAMMELVRKAGAKLHIVAEVTNTTSFHVLIEEEQEIGLMLDASRLVQTDAIRWVAIREFVGQFPLVLAWRKRHDSAKQFEQWAKIFSDNVKL